MSMTYFKRKKIRFQKPSSSYHLFSSLVLKTYCNMKRISTSKKIWFSNVSIFFLLSRITRLNVWSVFKGTDLRNCSWGKEGMVQFQFSYPELSDCLRENKINSWPLSIRKLSTLSPKSIQWGQKQMQIWAIKESWKGLSCVRVRLYIALNKRVSQLNLFK